MAEDIVHLHKDYNTTFCGEDASHIPMTYALDETTCIDCKKALEEARAQLKSQLDEHSANHDSLEDEKTKLSKHIDDGGVEIHKADLEHRQKMQELYDAQHKLITSHQELSTTVGISASKKTELESALQVLPQ